MSTTRQRAVNVSRVGIWTLGVLLAAGSAAVGQEWRFEPFPGGPLTTTPPTEGGFPLELVLDDGTAEGSFGIISGQTAEQFLWFNRFTPALAPPFVLEEIHVLFPDVPNLDVGDAVELVVYLDPDGDPTNGAEFLTSLDETVQFDDNSTFSVYILIDPILVEQTGDVLIGVVPRFIESGVTPPTLPAALDITSSQMRSWVATWIGDPPDPPLLPPDNQLVLIDTIQPGNWMIRAFGGPPVPTLPWPALAGLAALLLLAAALLLAGRRSRLQPGQR